MGKFAVIVMLPETEQTRVDFAHREFDTWQEFAQIMTDADEKQPAWRVVSVCHVEDLPMMMEAP